MSSYTFNQLVDVTQVRQLLESHHGLSGMAYGLFDTDENNLIAVGWQDICVRFHRVNPVSCARCRESDAYIKNHLHDFEGDLLEYRCKNGMIDIAMPIIIDGEHMATFFSGQFFYDDDRPVPEYYLMQAETLGFDLEDYLKALERVPVLSREHVRRNMLFLRDMVDVLARCGLNNLRLTREMEARKRAEEALSASEEKHRSVFESANDGIFLHRIVERDGETLFILHDLNQKGCELWGHSREHILSGNFDLLAMNNPPYSFEEATRRNLLAAAGQPQLFDWQLKRGDGSKIWGEVNLRRTRIGGEDFLLATIRDITERKRMETLLKTREREFRSLAENMPDNVARWDAEGRYLYVNSTHERTLAKAADLIGRRIGEVFPDGRFAPVETAIAQVVATGQPVLCVRQPVPTEDGDMDIHDVSLVPERDADGRIVSVLALGRDMTGIYRMQATIAEREQEFRSLAESSPDYIIRYDRDNRIRYLNSALVGLLALTCAEEVIGRVPIEVWPDGRYASIDRAVERAMATEEATTVDLDGYDDAGEPVFSQIRVVPERDVSGQVIGTIAFGRDVTELKRYAQSLLDRAKLQELLSSVAMAVPGFLFTIRVDTDGHTSFPFASSGVEDLFGLFPEEIRDDAAVLRACYHPDDLPRILDLMTETERTLAPFRIEIRIAHPRKGERWVEVRSTPQRQPDGATEWHGLMIDITERKLMEEALASREHDFRTLAENSPDLIYRYDRDCRRLYVNPVVGKIIGKPVEELIGSSPDDGAILVSEQNRKVMDAIRQVFDSGESVHVELDYVAQNNQHCDYHMLLVPERDSGGQVITVLAIARDITELKRMESLLEQREREFRALVENLPDPLFRYDCDCRRTYASPAVERITGKKPEEMVGQTPHGAPLATVPENDRLVRDIRHVLETGLPIIGELEYLAPNGKLIHFQNHFGPECTADGTVVGVLSIMRDVTEQKRMEEALKVREQEFRSLVENSPDTIVRYDRDCRRIYVNPAFLRLVGTPSEVLGTAPIDCSPIIDVVNYQNAIRHALESGEEVEYEYTWANVGGRMTISHSRMVPEWGADGKVSSVLAVGHDITDRKRTEKELQRKNSELERFTYTVSHDLKSPIITIKSFSGSIKQDLGSGRLDRVEKDLDRICAAADKMAALLDDLLELSRIGRIISTPEPVDMAALVHDVLKNMEGTLKEVPVRVSVQPGLPTVPCDRQRMMEVVQNLLENAVKFRGEQPEPRILVGLREEGGRQVFFVQDNGPGIDPKYHENIFGLFNRLNTQISGTGIGLALAKRIIEVHGGSIWVESEGCGTGSTFCFTVK